MWVGLSRAPSSRVNGVDLRDVVRELWRQGVVPDSLLPYLLAVACVFVASIVRFALGFVADDILPLATYYPAVLVASLLGGALSGVVALMLGGVIGWWAFMPPHYTIVMPTLSHAISLSLYAGSAALIVCIGAGYRRAMHRVREEEAKQCLLMEELQHRSKNTMAVVQSIVSQSLDANRQEAEKINGRIRALAATNDLLTGSAGQMIDLESLLLVEFNPYAEGRVVMNGGRLSLGGDLAKSLALVIHELATNAAKYGSLSRPDGVLRVAWKVLGGRAEIRWVERGGPPVVVPTKHGFGTQFIDQIIKTLQGAVATEFGPSGVECTISFLLPEPIRRSPVPWITRQRGAVT